MSLFGWRRMKSYLHGNTNTCQYLVQYPVQDIDKRSKKTYNTNKKESDNMLATNFSNVRNNFREVCDRVVQDSDIAIITRKNGENVVLMSQQQYDNLVENAYIRSSKANYDRLQESIKQAEDGKLVQFEIEE